MVRMAVMAACWYRSAPLCSGGTGWEGVQDMQPQPVAWGCLGVHAPELSSASTTAAHKFSTPKPSKQPHCQCGSLACTTSSRRCSTRRA